MRWSPVAIAAGMAAALLPLLPSTAGAATGPTPGSPGYIARDISNMEAAFGRQVAELEDPGYLFPFFENAAGLYAQQLAAQLQNLNRPSLTAGSLVPGFGAPNPDRENWPGMRGQGEPVTFTAHDGAELQGDVFAPLPGAKDPYTGQVLHGPYPGAVIVTGSIQASRDEYDWLAEDLAERGYVVLTFDVQGQGSSETLPHEGGDPDLPFCDLLEPAGAGQDIPCDGVPAEQDQNFVDSTEDAISFFLSTPQSPYPDVAAGSLTVNHFNPLWDLFDHSPDHHTTTPGRTTRLALIGHSTGAVIATYLQGVDPRIETVVALDKLTASADSISDDQAETGSLPGPVVPKVPALALQSEYGFAPQPYFVAGCSSFEPCPAAPDGNLNLNLDEAPNPNREEDTGFNTWKADGVDSMLIVPRASTHLIYTDSPPILPASINGSAMVSYYVQAWLGKYLQHNPAANYQLLSSTLNYIGPNLQGQWVTQSIDRNSNLSFYFCSGFEFNSPTEKFADTDLISDGCS